MALSDDEGAEDANDVRTDAFHESFDADPTAAALREYDINAANTNDDKDGDPHEISSLCPQIIAYKFFIKWLSLAFSQYCMCDICCREQG